MTYFKSLLINFLAVFFVNHILPGIEIAYYSKLPDIGGDLIFAFGLGFANSLIFPVMRFLHLSPSHFKIGLVSFAVSFIGYSIVNLLPLGIDVSTPGAYVWGGLLVWCVSYFTNHLEFKIYLKQIEDTEEKKNKKKGED